MQKQTKKRKPKRQPCEITPFVFESLVQCFHCTKTFKGGAILVSLENGKNGSHSRYTMMAFCRSCWEKVGGKYDQI